MIRERLRQPLGVKRAEGQLEGLSYGGVSLGLLCVKGQGSRDPLSPPLCWKSVLYS